MKIKMKILLIRNLKPSMSEELKSLISMMLLSGHSKFRIEAKCLQNLAISNCLV